MSDGHRGDVGLRGAGRGIAAVVLAAGTYTLLMLAIAWLTASILRVA